MEWTTVISILVPLIALFGFLYKDLKEWRTETREETNSIRTEIRTEIAEMQKGFREETNSIRAEIAEMQKGLREEIRLQSERSDKLYQMFIDLLKSQNPKTNP